MTYKYKMTQRPFGIGCQPSGAIDCINSNKGETGYHSIAVYDRQLTAEEIKSFELTPLEEDPIKAKMIARFIKLHEAQFSAAEESTCKAFELKADEIERCLYLFFGMSNDEVDELFEKATNKKAPTTK